MKYFISIFLSFLFLAACTNNKELRDDDQKARDSLVGVWRGAGEYQSEEDEGWDESWKIMRHGDGTFEVSYLLVNDSTKEYEVTSDRGKWSYENGRYFEVNSNNEKSVFKVYSVKKDWFEYNYMQRGDEITIQETKTVDDYQLQDPPKGYREYIYQASESDAMQENELELEANPQSD